MERGQGASVFEATTKRTVVIALGATQIIGSRPPSSDLIQKPVSKADVVLAHDGRGSITPSENTDECTVQLEVRRNPCGDQAGGGCRCLRAIPRGSSARVVSALGLTRFDRAPFLQMLPCPARRLRTWPERGSFRFDHYLEQHHHRHLLQRLSSAEGDKAMVTNAALLMSLSMTGKWTLTISRTFAMKKFTTNIFIMRLSARPRSSGTDVVINALSISSAKKSPRAVGTVLWPHTKSGSSAEISRRLSTAQCVLSVLLQRRQAERPACGNDHFSDFRPMGFCRCWLHALGHRHVRSLDQQTLESLRLGGGELGGGPQQIRPAKTKR